MSKTCFTFGDEPEDGWHEDQEEDDQARRQQDVEEGGCGALPLDVGDVGELDEVDAVRASVLGLAGAAVGGGAGAAGAAGGEARGRGAVRPGPLGSALADAGERALAMARKAYRVTLGRDKDRKGEHRIITNS